MYPVYINSTNSNIDFKTFNENFIKICTLHQNEGRASAFAFIIYDFHNPNVEHILYNDIYWKSLHRISGKYLTIFSFFDSPTLNKLYQKFNTVKMKFEMHSVDSERDVESSYAEIINNFFGGIELPSPSILFFQVFENSITDSFFVQLKENKIEEGFLEIKGIIENSVEAVKDISLENGGNYQEIFKMIKTNVQSAIWWKKTKNLTTKGINFLNFLSIFK